MELRRRSLFGAIVCALALLPACDKKDPVAPAVPSTGTLFLTVTTQDGSIVPGATVLTNPTIGSGVSRTDALGQILFESVPTATYSVLVSHVTAGSGRDVVQVQKDAVNRLTIRLQPNVHLEPSVRISQPVFSFFYSIADSVNLRATVADIADSPDSLKLTWGSRTDGVLATPRADAAGTVLAPHGPLATGSRWIVLRATNSKGFSGADSVFVTVQSFSPQLQILAPSPDAGFQPSDPITFQARVSDRETPASQLSVVWRSNVDAVLFSGAPDALGVSGFTRGDLSRGPHWISVNVSDAHGNVTRDSVLIHNDLPAAVVLHPMTTLPSGLRLEWDPINEPGFAEFRIYRATSANGLYTQIASLTNAGATQFTDATTTLGTTYWYRVGLYTTTGAESRSQAQSGSAGVFITVGRGLDRILLDGPRHMIYGIDRANNLLVFIDTDSLKVVKTMFIGSSPTDLDMDLSGTELFVANLGAAQISVVNLDTRTLARNLIVDTQGLWDGNPYRLACLTAGRLAWTSFDQWNSIKLIDTATGVRLSDVASVFQPGLTSSPDGTHLYVGESGISSGNVFRFDIVSDVLAQADISNSTGFTSQKVSVSGDGAYTYYGGKKLNSLSLRAELGTFSEVVEAVNADGSLVVGATRLFDGNTFAILRNLPVTGSIKTFGPDGHTLYSYEANSSRVYVLDMAPPAPEPGVVLARGAISRGPRASGTRRVLGGR